MADKQQLINNAHTKRDGNVKLREMRAKDLPFTSDQQRKEWITGKPDEVLREELASIEKAENAESALPARPRPPLKRSDGPTDTQVFGTQ